MAIANLPPETLYRFIVRDFEDAWDSLAQFPHQGLGRGNFMFARQAMTLLEFVCRLCASMEGELPLKAFTNVLNETEPRYFSQMPGICGGLSSELRFPNLNPSADDPTKSLLFCMFDMIRHGQAHQYQQIIGNLNDSRDFAFALTGADYRITIGRVQSHIEEERKNGHLVFRRDDKNDLRIGLRTDILFLDIKNAIERSTLLDQNLSIHYLRRPASSSRIRRQNSGHPYAFSSSALEEALREGGLTQLPSGEPQQKRPIS